MSKLRIVLLVLFQIIAIKGECGNKKYMCEPTGECAEIEKICNNVPSMEESGSCDGDEDEKMCNECPTGLPFEAELWDEYFEKVIDTLHPRCIPLQRVCEGHSDISNRFKDESHKNFNKLVKYEDFIVKRSFSLDERICLNGGTCQHFIRGEVKQKCVCAPGFTGDKCETKIKSEKPSEKPQEKPLQPPPEPTTTQETWDSYCANNGDCENGAKCLKNRCLCFEGFSGAQCEDYDANSMMGKFSKEKKELRKCFDSENRKNECSDEGYLCPFVSCRPCRTCERLQSSYFTTKELKGCIAVEQCVDTGVIPLKEEETCDKVCQVEEIVEILNGTDKGCKQSVCQENPEVCNSKPEPNACEELKTSVNTTCPHCMDYEVVPKPSPCKSTQCEHRNITENGCKFTCIDIKHEACGTCEKKSPGVDPVLDYDKCVSKEMCEPIQCEQDWGLCYFHQDGFPNSEQCPCERGYKSKIVEGTCSCNYLECEPISECYEQRKPCPKFYDKRYAECSRDSEECRKKHCFYLNNEPESDVLYEELCVCLEAPKDCAPDETMEYERCPLTEAQCKEDPECCEKKCPLTKDKIRVTTKCRRENCEVCPGDDGARIDGEEWKMIESCNSDLECCEDCECGPKYKCRHAREMDACPINWSMEKKKRCECRNV